MTKLLEKAFKAASKLPDTEQNIMAKWLLEELEAEKNGKAYSLNLKTYLICLPMKPLMLILKEIQSSWTSTSCEINNY